ncbi:MAG: hypothetical protein FWG16_04030 [Micrococcales bacterium]|nr:hypothetical protein [Micrococcales bacterium]
MSQSQPTNQSARQKKKKSAKDSKPMPKPSQANKQQSSNAAAGSEASRSGGDKIRLFALVAVVVVALVAIGVIWLWPSPSPTTSPRIRSLPAPDLLTKPAYSVPVSLNQGIDPEASLSGWFPTGLDGIGVAQLQSGTCEEDVGCPDLRSWLRGFSLTDGELLWTIDLADYQLGDPVEVQFISDPVAERTAIVAYSLAYGFVSDGPAAQAELPWVLSVIDTKTGQEVAKSSQVYYQDLDKGWEIPHMVTYRDGMVVVIGANGPSGTPEIGGFADTALEKPKWTALDPAPSPEMNLDEFLPMVDEWILTADGYVSVHSGKAANWGKDVNLIPDEDGELQYPVIYYRGLPDGTVARVVVDDIEYGTCQAWDTSSDKALWETSTDCVPLPYFNDATLTSTGLLHFSHSTQPGSEVPYTITAVSINDGTTYWTLDDVWVSDNLGDKLLTGISSSSLTGEGITLFVIEAATGQISKEIDTEGVTLFTGEQVIYDLQDSSGILQAHLATGDSNEPLWTLTLMEDDTLELVDGQFVVTDSLGQTFSVLQ